MEPIEENIGDYRFYILPFPALKAANMTGELASLLLPVFGALAPLVKDGNTDGKDGGLMDMEAGAAASAIASCVSVDGNMTEKLIRKFLLGGHIAVELENDEGNMEGYKLDEDLLDELFCGNVQDMFVLCFYVLRINFSGFFGKLASQSGKAGEAVRKVARKII